MKDKEFITAQILFQKGVEETSSGNYKVALKCFNKISKLNPDSPEVWNNKAFILFNLGRYEEVVRCCDKAIKLNPKYPDPWDIKARTLAKLCKHKESIAAAEKFIELAPPEYAARVREAKQYIEKASSLLMFDTVVTIGENNISVSEKEKQKGFKCLRKLKGHTDWVTSCAFSPDGRRIVSASYDKTFKLWDAETGEEITTLKGHTDWVNAFAFSPDGRRIVSAGRGNTLKLWDAKTVKELAALKGHTDRVWACAFSPDGKQIVSTSDDETLKIWNAKTGKEITTLKGHTGEVRTFAFSPDGKQIVSTSDDETLKLWDAETGEEITTLKGHTGEVKACVFSWDGRRIVLGDKQGQVLLLASENVEHTTPIVTPIRIQIFRERKKRDLWDEIIKVTCRWCGKRFSVPDKILDVIRAINRNANLSPDKSPCLELPDEAWEEPKLLSECPLCHKPLKFNPFIVDNSQKKSSWKFWK